MEPAFPDCPYLPPPLSSMDAGALSDHGKNRGAAFYETALTYAHYLWQRGHAARAILILNRAFGADLRGDEAILGQWPMPYHALAWILRHASEESLVGNPRVHFQHLAGRMNEPRREQRRWRAWACWALTRAILPERPGDDAHQIEEPSLDRIANELTVFGFPREVDLWWDGFPLARNPGAAALDGKFIFSRDYE